MVQNLWRMEKMWFDTICQCKEFGSKLIAIVKNLVQHYRPIFCVSTLLNVILLRDVSFTGLAKQYVFMYKQHNPRQMPIMPETSPSLQKNSGCMLWVTDRNELRF
jgi:hypothetical protein